MNDLTITPPPTLGVHVTERLRLLIVSGQLAPGTHLVEGRLSEMFDVSRGPIRDALRQLQAEGLLESRRRGVFVLGLSETDIDELYSLRTLLEAEALQRAVARRSVDWSAAESAVADMSAANNARDVERFAHADLAFHTAIYSASGHRRLGDVWSQYKPTFAAMLSVTNAQDRDLSPTLQDHVDLLAAARGGDSTRAHELLIAHMDGSQRRMSDAQDGVVAAARQAG